MNKVSQQLRKSWDNWGLGQKGPQMLLDAANEIDRLENDNQQLNQLVKPALKAAAGKQ
jgi:hypothetical protein